MNVKLLCHTKSIWLMFFVSSPVIDKIMFVVWRMFSSKNIACS